MYWSRVKSILIILFLLVNIFLLVNMMVTINQTITISPQTIQNTMNVLQKKNITIQQKEIPTKMQNVPNLDMVNPENEPDKLADKILGAGYSKQEDIGLQTYTLGSKRLVIKGCEFEYTDSSPDETISNLNDVTAESNAKRILERFRLDLKYIVKDNQEKLSDGRYQLTFVQRFSGKDIFNCDLVVQIGQKGIESMEGYWLLPHKFGSAQPPIRQITGVLIDFINNPDIMKDRPITITKITLGYYVDKKYGGLKNAFARPVWKIFTNDGGAYYYDAVDGNYLRQ